MPLVISVFISEMVLPLLSTPLQSPSSFGFTFSGCLGITSYSLSIFTLSYSISACVLPSQLHQLFKHMSECYTSVFFCLVRFLHLQCSFTAFPPHTVRSLPDAAILPFRLFIFESDFLRPDIVLGYKGQNQLSRFLGSKFPYRDEQFKMGHLMQSVFLRLSNITLV